jgi:RecB family exonuclease
MGIPDRIDETPDGIFVIDYKTAGNQPKAPDLVDAGYRLQLPFYALAAMNHFKKPALGVQFVELTREGSRTSGIFFERFNGKEPGKITQIRKGSLSLVAGDPDEVWSKVREEIEKHLDSYTAGKFSVKPKKPTECPRCRFNDLCGYKRTSSVGDSE